jgi:hypothetical protein
MLLVKPDRKRELETPKGSREDMVIICRMAMN